MAFPELYFGKFIVLAEGPSEEVVLSKIASAYDLELDTSFVCVVPLGGRHVNHFWKLLEDLKIPFATLLDLDAGRRTGGWARIKYVCEQLIENGVASSELLEFDDGGKTYAITSEELQTLHERELKGSDIRKWVNHLEGFGVFFSFPLDLDFSMLARFPDAYKSIDEYNGPAIPEKETDAWDKYIRRTIGAVVGDAEEAIDLYMASSPEVKELFAWYRYLFAFRSKPTTHILALSEIDKDELRRKAPRSISRLLNYCKEKLAS